MIASVFRRGGVFCCQSLHIAEAGYKLNLDFSFSALQIWYAKNIRFSKNLSNLIKKLILELGKAR